MKVNKGILDFLYAKKYEYLNDINHLKRVKDFDANSHYQYEHPILLRNAEESFNLIGEIIDLYLDQSENQ